MVGPPFDAPNCLVAMKHRTRWMSPFAPQSARLRIDFLFIHRVRRSMMLRSNEPPFRDEKKRFHSFNWLWRPHGDPRFADPSVRT
jgi:hypothetical protein